MTKRDYRSAAGFSLVEMMIVVGLGLVLTGMAVSQAGFARPGLKGDGAMRLTLGVMNQARQYAIQHRRYVRVVFTTPNLMQVVREDTPLTTTVCPLDFPQCPVVFEGNVQLGFVTGVPDTPDLFGINPAAFNGSPVAFGNVINVKFKPDGTLVNQDGLATNGTVFLAVPGSALSSRAVTVLGATGRVRGYRWDGKQWNVV